MNQDELAALLAVTHGSVTHASLTPPSKSKPVQPGLKAPNLTELSYPRDSASRPPRVGVPRDGDEVHPPSRPSTTVRSHGLQTLSGYRHHGKLTRSPGRRKSTENTCIPDFVVEERAAWNESPDKVSRGRTAVGSSESSRRKSVSPSTFRSRRPWQSPLAPTGPVRESSKKIKANHGTKPDRPDEHPEPGVGKDVDITHKAKFSEGSMSARSAAVSSTWAQLGARLSESSDINSGDPDADSPLRPAGRPRGAGGSLEVSEFLHPTTPSTIKRTLNKLGSHFKSSSDDSLLSTNEPKQTKRGGLRKSLSSWNLHLGERMHFFGSSTQDLANHRSTTPTKKQTVVDTELLDDRKRKAEAAYAEQFGTKKQKGNNGQATGPDAASPERRMVTPSARRRHASPGRLAHQGLDPAEIVGGGDVDRRKRPTRKELELENQQLRALLREREEKPSLESKPGAGPLPEDQCASSMPQTSTSTPTAPRPAVAAGPTRRQHRQRPGHDVPPVPPLPSRMVLATLVAGGNGIGSKHGPVDLPTKTRASGEIPRSVSTIMEDDENMPNIESGVLPGLQPAPKKDEWQWPDDVF
ncbi:hypothetical protein DV735_g3420, partial [Chaetothyriales sp. CBS 134920]